MFAILSRSSVPLPLPKVPGLLPVRTSFGDVRDRDEFGTYLEKETPKIRAAIDKAAGKHIPVIGVEVGVEHGDFANEVGRYVLRAEGKGCFGFFFVFLSQLCDNDKEGRELRALF